MREQGLLINLLSELQEKLESITVMQHQIKELQMRVAALDGKSPAPMPAVTEVAMVDSRTVDLNEGQELPVHPVETVAPKKEKEVKYCDRIEFNSDGEIYFDASAVGSERNNFELRINDDKTAEVYVVNDRERVSKMMSQYEIYLDSCQTVNQPPSADCGIETVKPGIFTLDAKGEKWLLQTPIEIKFIDRN